MSRIKRVILALVIVVVLIAIALTIAFAALYNTTFEKMGLGDKPILNGKSISDMKLQGYTPKDLAPLVKSLFKDNSSLIMYPPQSADKEALDEVFRKSDIGGLTVHYSRLIYHTATFTSVRLLSFSDKQLAAMLNNVVKQAPSDLLLSTSAEILEYLGVKAIKEVLNFLEEYDVTVEQIQLTEQDGTPHVQLLLSMDISQHTQGVSIPFLGELNSKVYLALGYSVNVTVDGELELSYVSLSVNGKDAILSEKVLDGLFIALSDSQTNLMTTKSLAEGVASFVGVVFEHVGRIGNGLIYGMSGVNTANRTICFVAG